MFMKMMALRQKSRFHRLCFFFTFCTLLLCFSGLVQAADDNEIVDLPESNDNLNDTFYLVDLRSSSGNESRRLSESLNNETAVTTSPSPPAALPFVDDFWDSPPPPSPSVITTLAAPEVIASDDPSIITTGNSNNDNEVNMVTFRVTVTSTPAPVTTTSPGAPSTPASSPSTVSSTRRPSSITTPTTTTTTTTTSVPSSTVATLRLHSNTVTVRPNEAIRVYSPLTSASTTSTTTAMSTTSTTTTTTSTTTTTTRKPTTTTTKRAKNKINYSFNSVERIPVEGNEEENAESKEIWKMTLHGTNMNSEELRMCNKTLLSVHFKPYSRRKVARQLKKELDRLFSQYHYRFSVLVQTTSRNTMGKALHGVWLSMSLNGVHYFITATYRIVEGPKLREEDLSRVEYWAAIHAIGSSNMTGFRRYNRISTKLKYDLDRQYGHGNVWSVVIVKNRYLVKARVLEDGDSRLEFSRLNGGHYIIWRGGQNIDDSVRNARYMSSGVEKDDEDTSEHSFREYNGSSSSGSSNNRGRRRAR